MPSPSHAPGRRLGLILPFLILAIGITLWSGYWWVASQKLASRMDRASGNITLHWQHRRIYGYPFRLEIDLVGATVSESSGWSISFPVLKAKAAAYSPFHWVFFAPDGARLTRPAGGGVTIGTPLLRASLSLKSDGLPHVIIEGRDMTFTPVTGARPFWLQSVRRLDVGLQPGPNDQQAILMRIIEGRPNAGGLVARITEEQPLTLDWQSSINHASSLRGRSWPDAVRAWSAAGGQIILRNSELTSSKARLTLSGGPITVGPDGRLVGNLKADLGEIVTAVARAGTGTPVPGANIGTRPETLNASLSLRDGKIHLGPLPIAPSPRIF